MSEINEKDLEQVAGGELKLTRELLEQMAAFCTPCSDFHRCPFWIQQRVAEEAVNTGTWYCKYKC